VAALHMFLNGNFADKGSDVKHTVHGKFFRVCVFDEELMSDR
jgi:hypothetical protein